MFVIAIAGATSTVQAAPAYCSQAPQSGWPFCDATRGIDDRAIDIVSRLSLADKITATVSASAYLPSVGLPPYQWWSEATHGLSGPGVHHNGTLPGATNTALPILTSCSFNRSLWHATGNAIAREGRAYANVNMSGLTFWTPVINIV
jgi:beta-D-xylosidase 4